MLIVFDDLIADMEANKRVSPIVTELLLKGRKLSILFLFISQYYLKLSKTTRLYETYYFIMKIPNKGELQQIALNHLYDINFKDFTNLWKGYNKNQFRFLSFRIG